jgi:hypothetical protein
MSVAGLPPQSPRIDSAHRSPKDAEPWKFTVATT